MGWESSQNFEGPSMFPDGYHWLPLASTYLEGDNKELNFGVYLKVFY